jgi:hypothetical protein
VQNQLPGNIGNGMIIDATAKMEKNTIRMRELFILVYTSLETTQTAAERYSILRIEKHDVINLLVYL